jgi:hypothetical protein
MHTMHTMHLSHAPPVHDPFHAGPPGLVTLSDSRQQQRVSASPAAGSVWPAPVRVITDGPGVYGAWQHPRRKGGHADDAVG